MGEVCCSMARQQPGLGLRTKKKCKIRQYLEGNGKAPVQWWRFRNQPQIILQFRGKCAFTFAISISLTEREIHNKLYITFNLVAQNKAFKILDRHVPSVEVNTLKWYFRILAFQSVMWKNLCDSNKILKENWTHREVKLLRMKKDRTVKKLQRFQGSIAYTTFTNNHYSILIWRHQFIIFPQYCIKYLL